MASFASPKQANLISLSCIITVSIYPLSILSLVSNGRHPSPLVSTHGNSPIPLTFQTPNATVAICSPTYASFTSHNRLLVLSFSNRAKVAPTPASARNGFKNNIAVIMMLKIWRVLPDMYIMKAFIGMAFAGASATSQAFLTKRSSVSVCEGADGGAAGFWDFCGGKEGGR